jgi:hypothetical protein
MQRAVIAAILVLAGTVLAQENSPLTGTWRATFADSVMSGTVYLTLTVGADGAVSGTYRATTGGFGKVSGKLAGDRLEFTMTQSIEECPGVYVGSLTLREGGGSGTYTGTTCLGSHQHGVVSMSRASAEELSAAHSPENPEFSVEYGKPEELRNVRTVYVYTALDIKSRDRIVKELEKHKELTVLENLSDGVVPDVILLYGAESFQFINTIPGNESSGSLTYSAHGVQGRGWAIVLDRERKALRIVWQFDDTRKSILERSPATNFGRNFVKILIEAQGKK